MEQNSLFGILGLLAGAGVILALLSANIQLVKKRNKELILGLVFIAIALRLGKSIVYFLLSGIAPIGLALGFLGLASIGPLVWMYLKNDPDLKSSAKRNWMHFIYPIIGFAICLIWYELHLEVILYQLATLVLALYLAFSWVRFQKIRDQSSSSHETSVILLLTTAIKLTFVYQHLSNTMLDYAIGWGVCAVFIYAYFVSQLLVRKTKKPGIAIQLPNESKLKIQAAIERDVIYLNSGITLNSFSEQLNVPTYLISKTVKDLYNKTFPDTISYFRIEYVKRLLQSPENAHLKIESLAYDAGFATPSAFYYAFKKQTGQTPTQYLQKLVLKSA